MRDWLHDHFGFRGAALILLGVMYVVFGIELAGREDHSLLLFYTLWPDWVRSGLWFVTGVGALLIVAIGAILDGQHPNRWGLIKNLQTAAFILMILPPIIRLSGNLSAFLRTGDGVWLGHSIHYMITALLVLLIAAWSEPYRTSVWGEHE